MQNSLTVQLAEVAKLRREPPTEVIAEAVEIGLSKLYEDSVLKEFLNKKISLKKAIQLVGHEAVNLAKQQHKIVQKDLSWGLGLEP